MLNWEGELYCNAKEAAAILQVSRPTFYKNMQALLKLHKLPARNRWHYRVAEVEQYKRIEVVA